MKKKVTKKVKSVSASEEVVVLPEATASEVCVDCKPKKIDNLTGIAGNEDFNKMVAKINELVDKYNDSI